MVTWKVVLMQFVPTVLQGELEVIKEFQNGEGISGNMNREINRMPFLMLGLDLPPPPLFKDVMEKNIIPQVII